MSLRREWLKRNNKIIHGKIQHTKSTLFIMPMIGYKLEDFFDVTGHISFLINCYIDPDNEKIIIVLDNAEDENIQRGEYEKFVKYVDLNLDKRIIFISSTSNRNSFYAKYKELAEAYLLTHHSDGIVLKFPVFIGKGLLPKLKSGEYMAFGTLELITLDNVVNIIEKYINDNDYQKRIYHIAGEKIEALTVLEILKI